MLQEDRRRVVKISGMDCPDCALTIEKEVKAQPGVRSAKVDYLGGEMIVDGENMDIAKIEKRVRSLGYGVARSEETGWKKTPLFVPDMDCADEEKIIRRALNSVEGVRSIEFDLIRRRVIIGHETTSASLLEAIEREGFKAMVAETGRRIAESPIPRDQVRNVAMSAALVAAGAIIELFGGPELAVKAVILAGTLVGGWRIGHKGLLAARRLRLDMNFLMSSAVIGAMVIDQWLEAGTVIVLFAIAQLLEAFSLDRSRRAITSLMDLTPRTARVVRNGKEISIPVDEVTPGEKVLVQPGEKIPVDGRIVSGSSSVNQAAITGESMPVSVGPEGMVYAGTINGEGALDVETIYVAGDTTIDRIIQLVEEARSARAPSQGFVDRFSRVYTPAVVATAIIVAVFPPLFSGLQWSDWIYRALALLVIACPCALVISTPVTIVSALTAAARNGVLIKGGVYLENLHRAKAAAFDKTGTITRGIPGVRNIMPADNIDARELLRIAASIENRSEHPIAAAILDYAARTGIALSTVDNYQSIPGKGARGSLSGTIYFVGKGSLFEEMGIAGGRIRDGLDRIENEAQTAVLVGTEASVLGIIAISDEIRPDSSATVAELKELGVERVIMLTGDNQRTAEAIGRAAGIDDIRSDLLPGQKVEAIKKIKGENGTVIMVGDGINDAPAMAAADIGIAMGAIGSDAALETADIALMSDEPSKIPWAFRLSKKSYRIIVENISMAIGIKAVFVVLAVMGLATLWMAVFADMGVSLLVIVNGMRALGIQPNH